VRVIFLDIDGVLNSVEFQQRRVLPPNISQYEGWLRDAERSIDPDAVARLNRIIDATGAVCVLSSTWRKDTPLSRMSRILRHRGFVGHLFAATPALVEQLPSGILIAKERGDEIRAWLDMLGPDNQPETFVVLDDDSDMTAVDSALVQTSWERGLTDADADRAILLLNTPELAGPRVPFPTMPNLCEYCEQPLNGGCQCPASFDRSIVEG
jgi:hypothetical protein